MALNTAQLAILTTELTNDTLVRGYSGMTVEAAAADIGTEYRTRIKTVMPATEVLNAMDKTEFDALTDAQRDTIWNVLSMGSEVNPNGVEKDLFVDFFGGGSTTISNLASARQENISRATELDLPRVRAADVIATGVI